MEGDLSFWLPAGLVTAAATALTLYSAWNRKGRGRYLCDDCRFNRPEDCLKVERPQAVTCLSYRPILAAQALKSATSEAAATAESVESLKSAASMESPANLGSSKVET